MTTKAFFHTRDNVITLPLTIIVGESRGKPNYHAEGSFLSGDEADRVSEEHKAAGRFASIRDAEGRPLSRFLAR